MRLARAWTLALAAERQNGLKDDLAEIDNGHALSDPPAQVYEVRSRVLSDSGILPGDLLRLRLLGEGETPADVSIAAVAVGPSERRLLLLRLFVPPRQLTINTACLELPQLVLGPRVRLIAAAPWTEASSETEATL